MDSARTATTACIGAGSNLGDKVGNIREGLRLLCDGCAVRLVRCASYYNTSPVGLLDQDWFVNTVAEVETTLPAPRLLECLLGVERRLGRVRVQRWGPRTLDLDLLFYADEVVKRNGLEVPHPELHNRGFVLVPLNEICPDRVHPVIGLTVRQLYADWAAGHAGPGGEVHRMVEGFSIGPKVTEGAK